MEFKVIAWSGRHLAQKLVVEKFASNQCQVIYCCVVIVIIETVGVRKMCIFTAKRFRLFVHDLGKRRHTFFLSEFLCYMLTNSRCHIICGLDKDAVECLFHQHCVTCIDAAQTGAIGRHIIDGFP